MSNGRHFPIQSFLWSIVLVAVAAVSVYLGYELVVVPRRALEDQIRAQKDAIVKLEQDKECPWACGQPMLMKNCARHGYDNWSEERERS